MRKMLHHKNLEMQKSEDKEPIIFGPVPSRRLGRSIGINNIPAKNCSYSCIYCQVGRTNKMIITRKAFYEPESILAAVENKIKSLSKDTEIDYLTFISDGEPTLDKNISETIKLLRPIGIKLAIVTNSSLLSDSKVRGDLMELDLVSVKIDTVIPALWKKINRPAGKLNLEKILNGIEEFAGLYEGRLITETMLVENYNDNITSLIETANFIKELNPYKAYILTPTRPPTEIFVKPPSEENLKLAKQIYKEIIEKVKTVSEFEGTDFNISSDAKQELLNIMSVHPMRDDAVMEFLKKTDNNEELLEEMISNNLIKKINYNNSFYFVKSNQYK